MKIVINIILIIFAVILQISLAPVISFNGGMFNLVLLVTISLVCIRRFDEGILWAGVGGVLLDLVSPVRFGIYTFEMLAIYFIIYYLVNHILFDPPLYLAVLIIFIASIIFNAVFIFFNYNPYILISSAIYDTVVGIIIYIFLRRYYKLKDDVKF